MLFRCILLCTFFSKCVAIPPDYYSDSQEEYNENKNYQPERRRDDNIEEPLDFSNETVKSTYVNSGTEDYNDDFIEDYVASQTSHKKQYSEQTTAEYSTKTTIKAENSSMPRTSRLDSLSNIYKTGWVRQKLHDFSNGTKGLIARLVTKYTFLEHDDSRCDTDTPIYVIGRPGSLCVQRGTRFDALCNDFGDPTRGYRLVAILAPIALFSLILYDLFSGVVRQTIN
ncbi:hypothetical protein OBRU01_11623 [Operophtera brumata]|uniref:Uncharacterized protein n=1 Tax=Operophtera brumata TaxID=104452 RepID=A0A0L7LBM9_OPEBR|nr:hypothetical protein OBRU01_11623 [Operophtera brumata]